MAAALLSVTRIKIRMPNKSQSTMKANNDNHSNQLNPNHSEYARPTNNDAKASVAKICKAG